MIETFVVKSEALSMNTTLKVILPNDKKISTLMIFLHGKMHPELSGELLDSIPKKLNLEELCNKYHMAVVIPLMKNRYYISTEDYDCAKYIACELPKYIKTKYGISDSVEMILAGSSMGGFGATLIGAKTGIFQKIISISGSYIAEDVEIGNPKVWGNLTPYSADLKKTFLYYFLPVEDLSSSTDRNALAALEFFSERGENPEFFVTCGTEDFLYSRNIAFAEALNKRGIKHQFYPIEHGEHDADCFRSGLWKAVEASITPS